MAKKTFSQQVATLFRGNLVHAFSQFAVISMLSKFGGSGAAGNYVLALAVTAPVFMFFDLNLRVVRSTDHQYNEKYSTYIGLRCYALILAVLISLLIGLVFYQSRLAIILPILVYRVGESLSNLAYGGLQRKQSSHLIGNSLSKKGLTALILLGILIPVSSGNEIVAAIAMAVISIGWALRMDLPLAWKINVPDVPFTFGVVQDGMGNTSSCWRIAKRAFPLGFDAGISSVAFNAPKYCIEEFLGTKLLGVFGVLSLLAFSIQKLIGAIGHTGVSVLSKQRNENNPKAFWRLFNRLLLSSVAVGIVAIIGGTLVIPPVIGWYLGPEYGSPSLMFTLLLASCLTGAQRIAGRATQACNRYFAYTMFDVIIFITSVIASITLIERYGLVGAGLAVSIAFAMGLTATLIHTYFMLWPDPIDPPSTPDNNPSA